AAGQPVHHRFTFEALTVFTSFFFRTQVFHVQGYLLPLPRLRQSEATPGNPLKSSLWQDEIQLRRG
ncbi:MAG TPA: hypothetical protein VK742_16660, partial [Candidatus Sulfotelmatobacter sp.]|nr:hypothetical protein [Candidatus Sulfotelmatobacter sp.]